MTPTDDQLTPAPSYLGEVSEATAVGTVAAVYADIRRVLGAPVVAFVYRALAIQPGRLERIWAELLPNLTSGYGRAAAEELAAATLAGVQAIPASALAVTGFDAARTAATLEAFKRVNCVNVLAVHVLLAGVDAPVASDAHEGVVPAPLETPALPTLDTAALPLTVRSLLEEMSEPVAGGEPPLLIPSLFRALAYDPCVLALLWAALRPALTSDAFKDESARARRRADELARAMPYRVTRIEDQPTREILRRFAPTIPGMLVTGSLLEAALAEAIE